MAPLQHGFFLPALAAHSIAALTIVFVPIREGGARWAAFIAIAACCFRAIAATDRWTDEGQNYAEYMFGFILYAYCFLLVERRRVPILYRRPSLAIRARFALVTLFNPRKCRRDDAAYWKNPPGRWTFIAQRTLKMLVLGAAYEYLLKTRLLPFAIRPHEIAPDKDSLVAQLYAGTLTRRDLLIRAEMVFLSLTLPALFIDTYHSAASVLAVLIFRNETVHWPPLFGNPLAAYSVGRFYGRFWETLMRQAFVANAAHVTRDVLGIRGRGGLPHTLVMLLVFVQSGIMHTVSGWTPGPCASWMPFWTYMATGMVVMGERLVFRAYQNAIHGKAGLCWEWKTLECVLWRLVGYCWVVFWWMEVLPWAIMPGMRCHRVIEHI